MNIKLLGIPVLCLYVTLMSNCNGAHNHDAAHEHEDEHAEHNDAHQHGEDEILFSPKQAKAAGIVIEKIERGDFAEVFTVSGSILPAKGGEATISATQNGIVQLSSNTLNEGSEVRTGQAIFRISTQILGDGNPVAAAKAEWENAQKEWLRAQQLFEERIISEREFDAIRMRYETAKSTIKSLGDGKTMVNISTPIGGFIQNLLIKNGDYVTTGQALATITQNRKLQLRAEVPERYYYALNDIVSANFRLSYMPESFYELEKMDGRLLSAGQTVNKGEGFLPVTFEFNNVGNIIPGSLAEVHLLGRTRSNVISIPISALTEELGLYYVYIQTSDHSYEKRAVKKGKDNGQRVEILEGLQTGEQLVARGAIAVKLAANSNLVPDAHAGHNH